MISPETYHPLHGVMFTDEHKKALWKIYVYGQLVTTVDGYPRFFHSEKTAEKAFRDRIRTKLHKPGFPRFNLKNEGLRTRRPPHKRWKPTGF